MGLKIDSIYYQNLCKYGGLQKSFMDFYSNVCITYPPINFRKKNKMSKQHQIFWCISLPDYSKRKFYYECDEEKTAVLKSCKNGEIYFPELEACDVSEDVKVTNNNNRFKRDTANQAGKQKQKIEQRRLGRNVRLGALYYGQTD